MNNDFFSYLNRTARAVETLFADHPSFPLSPKEFENGTFAYFLRGGKRLRPAMVSLCAGAIGGEAMEEAALPCALGVELYHNWTLIHDDIIDNDDTRRGAPSVHALVSDGLEEYKLGLVSREKSCGYGRDIAILAGDALHSVAVSYIAALPKTGVVKPEVALKIISLFEADFGIRLLSGEAIDTKNALIASNVGFELLHPEDILQMMAGKTGALFGISAVAGALIGKNEADETAPEVEALRRFAEKCGIAFQLQDDILGVTSTEKILGKPIGSDIREGKPTLLLLLSYRNASEEEREFLRRVVGKSRNEKEIAEAQRILTGRGGVEETALLAEKYIADANAELALLPESRYRALLREWSRFMLRREF